MILSKMFQKLCNTDIGLYFGSSSSLTDSNIRLTFIIFIFSENTPHLIELQKICNKSFFFSISNSFISLKQRLSNTLRMNFYYLNTNLFLHLRFYYIVSDYRERNNWRYLKKIAKKQKPCLK